MKQDPGGLRGTKNDGYGQIGRRETAPRLWKGGARGWWNRNGYTVKRPENATRIETEASRQKGSRLRSG